MKRLSLDEIRELQRASVIWLEQHDIDTETGAAFFRIYPMMICVQGEGGVLAFADTDSVIVHDINDSLINHDRLFWDEEPDPDLISCCLPWDQYNSFLDWIGSDPVCLRDLVEAVTLAGISFDQLGQAAGLTEDQLRSALIGKRDLSQEEKARIGDLLKASDDRIFDKWKIIDLSSRRKGLDQWADQQKQLFNEWLREQEKEE